MSTHHLDVVVNGAPRNVAVRSDRLLIDIIREDFGLTGTKEGCGIGVCGLCSVLVDGEVLSACLVPAVCVDGATVQTIEGLGEVDGMLSELQDAFIREGGFQCGICTPGQVVAASALLEENPDASEEEIREWLAGNLCRCTGYEGIVGAVVSISSRGRPT